MLELIINKKKYDITQIVITSNKGQLNEKLDELISHNKDGFIYELGNVNQLS